MDSIPAFDFGVLDLAAQRVSDYLRTVRSLCVAPPPAAVLDLAQFDEPLSEAPTDACWVLGLPDRLGSVVRVGVVQGEYLWRKHDDDDEFFYVVEVERFIDLDGRTVQLPRRQGFVVPRGVIHRTRAVERTVILMVENDGIVPTGNGGPRDGELPAER